MQAVILAAGKGTRMQPLTYEVPKPMLVVQGKPLLAYTLEMLPTEIDEVIIIIGYLGEQIKNYFGDQYLGKKIIYLEQKELQGTGAALFLAKESLHGRFLVMLGDDMFRADDIRRCLEHERSILTKDVVVEKLRYYGPLELDANGNLKNITYVELKPGDKCLIDCGTYVLDENIFKYDLVKVKDGKEYGLPSTIAKMAADYPVKIVKTDYWLPVGYPDDLKRAEIHLRKQGMIK